MFYILYIEKSIFNIYNDIESALVHLNKLSKFNSDCTLNEFVNGCTIGLYTSKNNKIFYTSLKNNDLVTVEYKNLPFELRYGLNNNVQPTYSLATNHNLPVKKTDTSEFINKNLSSEINVKLPAINTEIVISSDEKEINLDELKQKIEELNKLKDAEVNELEELNKDFHDFENKVLDEKFKVDAEKNKLKHDKEKWEEFKNIFNADKKIYKIMKEQFEKKEIDTIPELFEHKYPIFKILDDNNLLDTTNEIYEYIKLLPDDDSVYIPKNIFIKGLFNDELVSSISLTELKENRFNFETTIDTDDEM